MSNTLNAPANQTFTPALPNSDRTTQRVERQLDELEALWDQIEPSVWYPVPEPTFHVPADFVLSIVIPVYNEEKTILEVLARVRELPIEKEIIVVDDCSTDETRGWLEALRGAPGLKLIFKEKNEGKGAALRTGFQAATGNVIVIQDADLEYDPRDIMTVIQPIVAGDADAVFGSRFLHETPQDKSLVHRLINRSLSEASNLFTRLRLTDMETCYKAFRRNVIREMPLRQNRFGFEPEVTAKLARRRYRIVERPISYNARGYSDGKKIGLRDAFNAIYCIVRYGLKD